MMAEVAGRASTAQVGPLYLIVLVGALPLYLGALLSDLAYSSSYQVQWKNFASWLLAGGLLFNGLALLGSLIDRFRPGRGRLASVAILLLAATWVVGLIDALIHAKDAWASMPAGLILSVITVLLAIAAIWIGLSAVRSGDAR